MEKICKSCGKLIQYRHWREFACHCASCKSNPNVLNKYKKISKALNKQKIYELICKKCNNKYIVSITENCFNKGTYKKYCSRSCANSRQQTEKINKQRSESVKKQFKEYPEKFKNCGWKKGHIIPKEVREKISISLSTTGFSRQQKKLKNIKCEICNKKSKMHHINGDVKDNSDENTIKLCRSCHSKIHAKFGTRNGVWAHSSDKPIIGNHITKEMIFEYLRKGD